MKYSQDLIDEVKKLYPNSKEMHNLVDNGGEFLGRYLDDSSSGNISPDTILKATSLQEIQDIARSLKKKIDLYRKWCAEMYPNR